MRILALFFALSICASTFASAQEACHFGSTDAFDGLIKSLSQANSCSAAVKKLHDCAWGSSADTQFAPIVIAKCEKTFFNKLSSPGKARYGEEMQLCAYEYSLESGTLAMSEAALCQVDVAADFSAHPSLADRPATRASFDCSNAQTPLEKAICSDIKLGHADIILSRVYAVTLKNLHTTDKSVLVQSERQWLHDLPAKCSLSASPASETSLSCIRNEFELRFTALDSCDAEDDGAIADCLSTGNDDTAPAASPQRASFDCEKPSTALEIVICADANLGQTDIKLSQAYHATEITMGADQHTALVDSERQWLRYVNQTCPLGPIGGIPPLLTRSCIATAFETRMEQLQTCPQKNQQERIPCLDNFLLFPKKQDTK
jgi:uncharacterized protein